MADPVKIAAFANMVGTLSAVGTSFDVEAGKGARFPTTSDGSWNAFIYDDYYRDFATAYHAGAGECLRISARSTDTFTISNRAYIDPASKGAIAFTDTSKRYRVELNINNDNLSDLSGLLAPSGGLVKPILTDLTWVNQSTATATQTNRGIYMEDPKLTGDHFRILKKSQTGTYIFTVGFNQQIIGGSGVGLKTGIILRQSSDGKLIFFGLDSGNTTLKVYKFNSPGSISGEYAQQFIQASYYTLWLRFVISASTRVASVAIDGENFLQVHTTTLTDFLTPDEIGLAVNSNASSVGGAHYYSFKVS